MRSQGGRKNEREGEAGNARLDRDASGGTPDPSSERGGPPESCE